jgi:hypothetical protein
VVLDEHGLGFFLLVVDVQPSRRFGEKEGEDEDQRREKELVVGLEKGADVGAFGGKLANLEPGDEPP